MGWAGHGGSWFPVPSPHALHVGAQPDARTAPAPSCWETLCSHPTGRPLPPSRGERSLLLKGVNELCPTAVGTGSSGAPDSARRSWVWRKGEEQ